MNKKFIKEMVIDGLAKDITNFSYEQAKELLGQGYYINLSFGRYGMNAGLFRNTLTGELYAVLARNTLLFKLV